MKYIKVKDLGQIVTGNTPPTTDESNYGNFMPFIKATDIQLGCRFTYITEQSYSEKSYNKYKANLIPKGSTCIVTIGSIGKKMTQAHTDLFVNQAINAILPNKQYDKDYVYYVTRYAVLPQLKIYDSGTTSGRENISKSSFSNIRLFIEENLSTQRKIASILSTYDNLIENNAKRIKLLEQMAENLYKEWFVRFRFPGHEHVEMVNGLPKGWKVERYGNIATITAGGDCPIVCSNERTEATSVPIFSNGITNNGLYGFTDQARISQHCITISARGTIGFVCLHKEPFVPIVRLLAVIPKQLGVHYLYHSSKNNDLEGNGTSQQQLTKPMLAKRKIIIPTKQLCKRFETFVLPLYNQIDKLTLQSQLLTRQRDLLLPRLMSGKLEVKL